MLAATGKALSVLYSQQLPQLLFSDGRFMLEEMVTEEIIYPGPKPFTYPGPEPFTALKMITSPLNCPRRSLKVVQE